MKSLFLTLVLVFGTGTMLNASSSTEKNNNVSFFGCWEVADMASNHVSALMEDLGMPLSYEQNHNVWVMYYESCIS